MGIIAIGSLTEVIIQMPVGELRQMRQLQKTKSPTSFLDCFYLKGEFFKRVDDGAPGRHSIVAEMSPDDLNALFS